MADRRLLMMLRNDADADVTLEVAPDAYSRAPARRYRLSPGAMAVDAWDLNSSDNWYDFSVTSAEDPAFLRRFAGHGEDGRPSRSDPALGRQARQS
jgi:phospholipase C